MSPLKRRTFRSYNPAFDSSDGADDRRRVEITQLGTVTAAHNRIIFRSPTAVEIKQISIVVATDVAVSGANYFTFDVQNVSKGNASLFSTPPDTQAASLNGLSNDENTDLDPDQHLFLAANDVLRILIAETGVTTNLDDMIVIVDWEVSDQSTTTSSSTTTTTTTTTTTSTTTTTTTTTTTSTSTTVT